MSPKQIKVKEKKDLFIKWNDGNESLIPLKYLRDECPCANCKGETVLLKTYRPVKKAEETPGMYVITDIKTVGGYAIQISWQDGHSTGIYSWEYLRKLDEDKDSGASQDYSNLI